jgi:hypothetical protein
MPDWMPVFLLVDRIESHHAAHPDHREPISKESGAPHEEALPRVGTAVGQPDGSYIVELTALPVKGRLLMRPPEPTDRPTHAVRGGN